MALTQDLGRFVADVSFARLPQGAADVARTGFIDCIATMIAGAGDPAPQLVRKALHPTGGEASLYFTGERSPAPEAAWINGTAGHALDYDAVAALRGHPSGVDGGTRSVWSASGKIRAVTCVLPCAFKIAVVCATLSCAGTSASSAPKSSSTGTRTLPHAAVLS